MPSTVTRIAMWSGPRNISTAMMRSWENRTDCHVVDEPFYACYLHATGIDHPMRDDIVQSQATDWRAVVDGLTAPLPPSIAISYQKHMAHHMIPEIGHDWFQKVTHAFLIRPPEEMVASYAAKREQVTPADLGLDIQAEIYREVLAVTGRAPPVLNATDVLKNPRAQLRALCAALDVPFDENMLHWPPGPRDGDGVWAAHWYHSVEDSTGFAPFEPRTIKLDAELQYVADACQDAYVYLNARRIRT